MPNDAFGYTVTFGPTYSGLLDELAAYGRPRTFREYLRDRNGWLATSTYTVATVCPICAGVVRRQRTVSDRLMQDSGGGSVAAQALVGDVQSFARDFADHVSEHQNPIKTKLAAAEQRAAKAEERVKALERASAQAQQELKSA